jgi:hypothetical protein
MINKPEFIDDDYAMVGDIIINMATPDPEVPLDSPKVKETDSLKYSPWGATNLFPQEVISKVEADTELGALLDWKGRLLQGKKVIAVQDIPNKEGKDFDTIRVTDQAINDFLNDIPFQRYWREACTDFTWFQNIFPDLIKSKGGKTIASINCHHAAWTRLGKMNPTGTVVNAYVAVDWETAKPDDEYTKEHVVVDPYDSAIIENTKKKTALKRFIYPVSYPSPGKAYYSLAPWIAFLNSDWYNIKNLIPKWKLKFMQRILSASKILVIPASYWALIHKDWESLDKEARLKIKKEKVAEISKSLTGIEGAGTTILSETGTDSQGNPIPSLEIKSIESGFTDGQHLEDSQEASQHLMRSLNVDPTLVGNGPGRGKDAGSGSDKRLAMNIATAILTPYRNVILEPLVFKAKYDGWMETYPGLRFEVVEVDLGTLDNGPTSKDSNPVTVTPEPAK